MSRASRYTIQGHEVTIPVEVRDASAHMASFLVPVAAAQDLIGYSGLEVAEPLPCRAVCSLAFMRSNDIRNSVLYLERWYGNAKLDHCLLGYERCMRALDNPVQHDPDVLGLGDRSGGGEHDENE